MAITDDSVKQETYRLLSKRNQELMGEFFTATGERRAKIEAEARELQPKLLAAMRDLREGR